MNWGKSIILAFVGFAIFIGVLVAICIRQEVSLVSKNYYEEELSYQDRIESMNNYSELSSKPDVTVSKDVIQVQLNQHSIIEKGTMVMFRPSDGKLDRKFILKNTATTQEFDVSEFPKGLYRMKLQWSMESKDYFLEKLITL
ncbi:hypothetical protein BH09BAC3_BH09BAC3_14270 [soil metagenome]